jgi:hypothetical protein
MRSLDEAPNATHLPKPKVYQRGAAIGDSITESRLQWLARTTPSRLVDRCSLATQSVSLATWPASPQPMAYPDRHAAANRGTTSEALDDLPLGMSVNLANWSQPATSAEVKGAIGYAKRLGGS